MLRSSIRSYLNQLNCKAITPAVSKASRWDFTSGRGYAKGNVSGIAGLGKKKLGGKTGPTLEKKVLPVETDPVKLVNYCCGTDYYEKSEPVKLKDDSEYPEWLWTLNTGPHPSLDELDPDTEEYWERAVILAKKRKTSLLKLKKF